MNVTLISLLRSETGADMSASPPLPCRCLRSCVVLALRQMLILVTGSALYCHACEHNLKQSG